MKVRTKILVLYFLSIIIAFLVILYLGYGAVTAVLVAIVWPVAGFVVFAEGAFALFEFIIFFVILAGVYYLVKNLARPYMLDKIKRFYDGSRFDRILEAEKRQGYRSAYRKSVKNKINQRDVNPIESEKERALVFLMICEEVDETICKNGKKEEKLTFVRDGVQEVKKKAASTGISVLDMDIAAIEHMVDVLEEAVTEIKGKVKEFIQIKELRYSTIKVFMDKVNQETRPLTSVFDNIFSLLIELDKNIDQVIYSQDEAIVSGEYGENAVDRQQCLVYQIDEQIRETREKLDITVQAIRNVFVEQI